MGLKINPPLRSENLARFRGFLFFSDFDFRKNSRGFLFFSDFDFGKNTNLGFYFFQKSPESRFLSVFPFDNAHFTPNFFPARLRRAFLFNFALVYRIYQNTQNDPQVRIRRSVWGVFIVLKFRSRKKSRGGFNVLRFLRKKLGGLIF